MSSNDYYMNYYYDNMHNCSVDLECWNNTYNYTWVEIQYEDITFWQVSVQANFTLYAQMDSSYCFMLLFYLGLDSTKPVFGVSAKASFKPVSSATETS